ncbi:hypothetical protein OUZ56_016258 [Daphnia magna]|uniref:Uncharacterized protein n=1 Tax=Daphnia magna TaxID=35525 RepID=A0ABR0AQ44_9CRUS|nr:hypothetical protein OUZ56_016258 [Daphnia magna]
MDELERDQMKYVPQHEPELGGARSFRERALSGAQSDERSRSNWKNVSGSASEDLLSGSSMTATPSSNQYLRLIG